MAPPVTLTLPESTPRSRIDWIATAANASLISIKSRSVTERPAFLRACMIALDGCECSELSGPATTPCAPTSASNIAPLRDADRRDLLGQHAVLDCGSSQLMRARGELI